MKFCLQGCYFLFVFSLEENITHTPIKMVKKTNLEKCWGKFESYFGQGQMVIFSVRSKRHDFYGRIISYVFTYSL